MTLSGNNNPIKAAEAVYAKVNKTKEKKVDISEQGPEVTRSNKPGRVTSTSDKPKEPEYAVPSDALPDPVYDTPQKEGPSAKRTFQDIQTRSVQRKAPSPSPQDTRRASPQPNSKKEEDQLYTVTEEMQKAGLKNPPHPKNTRNAAAALVQSMSRSQDGAPPPPPRPPKPARYQGQG